MLRHYQNRKQLRGAGVEEVPRHGKFEGRLLMYDLATISGNSFPAEGRDWLMRCLKEQQPLGWSVLHKPDRGEGEDNSIAVMQFASADTALIIRTHATKNWLPEIVEKVLKEPSFKKIFVALEGGSDKLQKMESTFNFLPAGVIDLEEVAKRKGVEGKGVRPLGEHCGLSILMEARIRRSNWEAAEDLSQEQIRYAAEEAYFTRIVHDKLSELPDKVEEQCEGYDIMNQGILTVKPEWEGIIVRKADGLWCTLCDKGPMNVPMVVESHLGGKQHKACLEAANGGPPKEVTPLSEEYVVNGIIQGDDLNGVSKGQFKCIICNAGPFIRLPDVDGHLQSKKHKSKSEAAEAPPPKQNAEPVDKFIDKIWNFPDYVTQQDNTLTCTLCGTKPFSSLQQIYLHLGGQAHAKKCRSAKIEEIFYVKDRERLEYIESGKCVIRTGYVKPKSSSSKSPMLELPEGWQAFTNPNDGTVYYWHEETDKYVFDRAELPDQQKTRGRQAAESARQCEAASVEPRAEAAETARQCEAACVEPSMSAASGNSVVGELPEGWEEYRDPSSGDSYYYHTSTGSCQWERPMPQEAPAEVREDQLPPGWIKAWSPEDSKYYYADIQTQRSQFDPPSPHSQDGWSRKKDPMGKAFWVCGNLHFFESDETSGWIRMEDGECRTYWSNEEFGIRFFELDA